GCAVSSPNSASLARRPNLQLRLRQSRNGEHSEDNIEHDSERRSRANHELMDVVAGYVLDGLAAGLDDSPIRQGDPHTQNPVSPTAALSFQCMREIIVE